MKKSYLRPTMELIRTGMHAALLAGSPADTGVSIMSDAALQGAEVL